MTVRSVGFVELLNSALQAVDRNQPEQANALIGQLPSGIANRIFRLTWEESGRPMDKGSHFGKEAFLGQNPNSIDAPLRKRILERVIGEQSWQNGSHTKLYATRGAQPRDAGTSFCLFAPNARRVSLVLMAEGREERLLEMQKNERDGTWETATRHAPAGRSYLYEIVDCRGKTMRRTDPFSYSTAWCPISDQIHSVVVNHDSFQWGDQEWMQRRAATDPLKSHLSIYELQAKSWKSSFTRPLNFRELARELIPYSKKMGFTHIELFGFLEHFHQGARGYQVTNFFTHFRDYGSCDDFKFFVDQMHQNGTGVIIDWIPAHFRHLHQNPTFSLSIHELDGTNLFAAGGSPWGTLYLDYSKEETSRLMFASALYFLDKLHIDGIRFDAVSQMVRRGGQDIPSAISFLKELNSTIQSCYPGAITIAEETEGFPKITQSPTEGGLGFHFKWDIGWSHDARDFLRTPFHERSSRWNHKIMRFLRSCEGRERVILTHSHDDTDAGAHSSAKVLPACVAHIKSEEERFALLRNFFCWQRCAPSYGTMLHMGDELVQGDSWYQRFCRQLPSVDWALEISPGHQGVQECIRDLNQLYLNRPQLLAKDADHFSLIEDYAPNGFVAYHRGTEGRIRLAVLHNFSAVGYPSYMIRLPSLDAKVRQIAEVREIFNSDRLNYGGTGKYENRSIEIIRDPSFRQPSHLRLSLPPNATLILEEELAQEENSLEKKDNT